jgi:hypothetical protein
MKKVLSIFAAILSFAIIFTACEPQTQQGGEGTIDTTNAEVVNAMSIYNAGPVDYKFPSFRQFVFEGYTGTVNYDPHSNNLEGSGYVIQISQALSFIKDNEMPNATSFVPFELTEDGVEEVFSGGAVAIQYFVIEDGKINQAASAYTYDFKVEMYNNTIAIQGNFYGEVMTFCFNGTPTLYNDSPYTLQDAESTNVVNTTAKFAQAQVIYYGTDAQPLLPYNVIEVVLVDNNMSTLANFYCYGSLDDVENVYGTFTISNEVKVGSAAPSAGFYVAEDNTSYPSPSFIVLNNNAQTGAGDYYLVNGGTISVSEDAISFDLTTLNGSNIKSDYTGKIELESYKSVYGAPQAKAPVATAKEMKPLHNVVKF